jgi:serine/threonine protein kinase
MELAPGGELFDHCVNVVGSSKQPNPPMPERGLQLAARQILRGLAHAHLRGIVHLDLKMENILLKNPVTRADWSAALDTPDAPIQLKIMDYGFCAFTIGEMDNVKWSPHNIPGTEGYRCCARTRPRRVCPRDLTWHAGPPKSFFSRKMLPAREARSPWPAISFPSAASCKSHTRLLCSYSFFIFYQPGFCIHVSLSTP